MSRRSTPTSSSAAPTSGSGRTSARCTARPTSSIPCRRSRCAPPMTDSRPARRRIESIAGTLAATDYLRDVGRSYGDVAGAPGAGDASERRRELVAGMTAIVEYERELVGRLIAGLEAIRGVEIHGIADRVARRRARADGVGVDRWRRAAGRRRDPGSRGDLRLGRRLLRDRAHRATGQGRGRAACCGSGSSTTTPPTRSTGRSRRSSGWRAGEGVSIVEGYRIRTDGRRPGRPPTEHDLGAAGRPG